MTIVVDSVAASVPMGGRVVVECKDVTRLDLSGWVDEADVERLIAALSSR